MFVCWIWRVRVNDLNVTPTSAPAYIEVSEIKCTFLGFKLMRREVSTISRVTALIIIRYNLVS
jgi:hypothetical protein